MKLSLKTHWILTCMSYMIFGMGSVMAAFGIKNGLGAYGASISQAISVVYFIVIQFTSAQKIRKSLFPDEQITQSK